MAILRAQSEVAEASSADLVETYNALTGKTVKKFENITVARRRVEAAMMASKDADGHTGVPKGSEPQVRTRAEIVEKATSKDLPVPPAPDSDEAEPEPQFPPGSLAAGLAQAGAAAKPIAPRPKKTAAPSTKASIYAVQATFVGTSKPQVGSVRNNVLLRIQNAKNNAATIDSLDKHFEHSTRGYIQKLIEKNHLRVLNEAEYAAAQPVAQPKKAA